MRATIKRLMALLLAIMFTYSYCEVFIPIHDKSRGYIIFIYGYLFVLSFIINRYLIKKSSYLIMKSQLSKIIIKLFVAISVSCLVLFFIPKDIISPINYSTITLTPIASENSNTAEVWLKDIKIDNSKLDLKNINLSNGWIYKDEDVVSIGNNENPLRLTLSSKKSITLVFGKHAWSGKVNVFDGVENNLIDLHSEIAGVEELIIEQSNESKTTLKQIIPRITFIILFSMIFTIIFYLLKKMFHKNIK